jgi:hypothetical protein
MADPTSAITAASDLDVNAARFRRHLRASGLSPKTESTYLDGVRSLTSFLVERGMPTALESITREHLEEWLVTMRAAGRGPTRGDPAAARDDDRHAGR